MHRITIGKEIAEKVPEIVLSCIECDVVYQEQNGDLWNEIGEKIKELNSTLKVEEISKIPAIAASRRAYKKCGKDPARYRLSAEALLRRVLKRGEIYQVNNVVDQLNLVSISSGFSIGGYDADTIEGDITFGIGANNEPYEGIGRGELNIEFMPVFRDAKGAFGTPTSDSVRTCVTNKTKRFLMIIIAYEPIQSIAEATTQAQELLTEYAGAKNFELETIQTI
ncbi:phenylalanine--tRNA ligase beta subunit-related protein [Draconibacterium sp. IB214405]|uniref:B3/B4 domain-containing protein n=1 Tax=Draconibacterium sp. IB214405 TaxID=3097352 RepID=UPI002A170830|nr:phenylalanine--tRNA ligase beta subunit-related protein [Draconibacterium sp. IB214405]MDX8339677.1 phenylalanine--tRNA ligase beta subunit-related protein [Draconibacterium sp. IB214405]